MLRKPGDPYQREIEHCTELIMQTLNRPNEHTLAYQSRVGPVEWLKPYTEEAIPQLAEEGVKDLLVVPISFVSEHIETLEEIDMEYRELAEESGIEHFYRVPALNTHPGFIHDLSELVMDALEGF
jgi:ferrochelatase